VIRIKSGRYSKFLRTDIAKCVQEFAEKASDTLEEEALVRWMIGEFLKAYTDGEIGKQELYTNILAGVETLRRAWETRQKMALAKQRVILPEQFIRLVAVLGDIVQKRVSDPRERQLVAADFASLLRGQRSIVMEPDYPHPTISEDATVKELIESAVYVQR